MNCTSESFFFLVKQFARKCTLTLSSITANIGDDVFEFISVNSSETDSLQYRKFVHLLLYIMDGKIILSSNMKLSCYLLLSFEEQEGLNKLYQILNCQLSVFDSVIKDQKISASFWGEAMLIFILKSHSFCWHQKNVQNPLSKLCAELLQMFLSVYYV